MTNTVVPLPKSNDPIVGPLRTEMNKGLFVHWINADLMERAGHDIHKSIIFYDEGGAFETALLPSQWDMLADAGKLDTFLEKLCAATAIRYYSKGIK